MTFFEALQTFAESVHSKMSQLTTGEPEDQLRGPFENLMAGVKEAWGWDIESVGESTLPDRLGKPDYAIIHNGLLTGYVELKAPGVGANAKKFKGHNRDQFKRFSAIPNILYTDGNEWALYRSGELEEKILQLSGDISTDGKKAVEKKDTPPLERLLKVFLEWEPIIPKKRNGKVDLKEFAAMLAPLCRMLREDVTEALEDPDSPLIHLAKDWRQLLFPEASDEQFADAYAQTVTFALLLGRSEGADPLTLDNAEASLEAQHNLLSRALQVLTVKSAQKDMDASLDMLIRVIAAVPPDTLAVSDSEDPWLYFYEDFLAAYDPDLRKDAGAYYTPVEVVRCQVRLINDLLVNRLGKPLGFGDPGVVTLDPAAGTGTYLLGVIKHALDRIEEEQGPGAVAGQATELAKNLYGFEIMVGPYAVTELRVSRALRDRGAELPKEGTHVYLTDTLESPYAEPPQLPLFLRPIAEQHAKALDVKSKVPVIVCLGNPPYDRHEAATEDNKAQTGGWVRWGDDGKGTDAIFKDFIEPAVEAGYGVHIKNLYNLYVYFWRWSLWKVFEHESTEGAGVVSFISASSYLDGDAFCGMREHIRRYCDEIFIIDVGGEGRGTRRDENVFNIQTPVAICIAVSYRDAILDQPALVHYTRIEGSREEKLSILESIDGFSKLQWEQCAEDWQEPFRPGGKGDYFTWPLLTDLMPWQHSGCEIKRTWPICHDKETLKHRWQNLMIAQNIEVAFKETRDRKINSCCPQLIGNEIIEKPINQLSSNTPPPIIQRYFFRSFDRQWIFVDNRLGDYFRPVLWQSYSSKQFFLSSSVVLDIGNGPALTSSSNIPDRHYFSGRGGKDIIPLYRSPDATEPNILPGLLELLSSTFYKRKTVTPEDFAAYVYGILAQPAFTEKFHKELETRQVRVPITKEKELFEQVRDIGAHLLWLHTYGERLVPKGKRKGQVPKSSAKCTKAVPGTKDGYPETFSYNDTTKTLHVGEGEFAPVEPEVFEFEVSGLKVVQSWLKYRMKKGAGKKSSPLDDIRPEKWTGQFTTELLELLWVLEATLVVYPRQAELLEAVIEGECFTAEELPKVPDEMRKPPKPKKKEEKDLFEGIGEE